VAVIILPKYLVPVRPRGVVLEKHAVVVEEGRIVTVGPAEDQVNSRPGAEIIRLEDHVLIPGLVNTHTHAPMTLLRGYADDLRLDTWLNEHIWPAENRWADARFTREGTELAITEMIRGGTTCFNDMYFFVDEAAAAAAGAGMRACLGITVIEFKTAWAGSFREYIDKGLQVRSDYSGNELISFSIAPHSMYSVTGDMLAEIADLSQRLSAPIHLHLLEIEREVENSLEMHRTRPVQRALELGLLNERLVAVHMVHLQDDEIGLLAEHGVNVVHCPQSNLKLASGMCRVADLVASGVNVCIGTDGAAANNDLDMWDEMRTAALLAKGVANDPKALDAVTALDAATINGAKALGLEAEIGSVEEGKMADLCAIDLSHPRTQPVHHVISQLVYAVASNQVTDVWVAGNRLLDNGELTTIDEQRVLSNAQEWSDRMRPYIKESGNTPR
jgi:5-methylthioadenosine/S-adenosylhomocysteine deaminase